MKSLKSQNFYDVLGVSRMATADEIRSAYEISRHTFQENSLATYSLFSDSENQEILKLISKAFETLFNPEARRAYDATLEIQEGRRGGERADGARAESARGDASRGELGRSDHGRAEPIRSEPARSDPGRADLGRADLSRAEPIRAEPSRPEFARTEMSRAELPRPELARVEPRSAEPRPAELRAGEFRPSASSVGARPRPVEEARRPPVAVPAPAAPAPAGNSAQSDAAVEEFLRGVTTFDGAVLRKLRQMRGVTLDQLAEQTKIRRAYLEYIEEESFQFLPAAVYVKGFLTIVANQMHLPVQRVCVDYMAIYSAKKH